MYLITHILLLHFGVQLRFFSVSALCVWTFSSFFFASVTNSKPSYSFTFFLSLSLFLAHTHNLYSIDELSMNEMAVNQRNNTPVNKQQTKINTIHWLKYKMGTRRTILKEKQHNELQTRKKWREIKKKAALACVCVCYIYLSINELE